MGYLEYLLSILMQFNSDGNSKKDAIIWYFREDVKTLVRVEIKKRNWELNSFDEIVQKTVDTEAKTAFRPRFYIRETNKYCSPGNCLTVIKSLAQGPSMKEFSAKKPKFQP